jgi:hypothetical protein
VSKGTAKNSTRPRGRPALSAESVKRHALGIRTTKALKDALLRASEESGRSLAQEIELRLERSIDNQKHLAEVLELVFGRQVAGIMLAIGYVMKEVLFADPALKQPDGWLSNSRAFGEVAQSITALLQVTDPDVNLPRLAELRKVFDTGDSTSELLALTVAEAIAFPDVQVDLEIIEIPWAAVIRSWLGDAAIARLKERLRGSPALPIPHPESE